MAKLLLIFGFLFSMNVMAGQTTPTDRDMKAAKLLFDKVKMAQSLQGAMTMTCVGAGMRCDSSVDCCGSSICRDGACTAGVGECIGEGGSCDSSVDCCGSNFCRSGYCG